MSLCPWECYKTHRIWGNRNTGELLRFPSLGGLGTQQRVPQWTGGYLGVWWGYGGQVVGLKQDVMTMMLWGKVLLRRQLRATPERQGLWWCRTCGWFPFFQLSVAYSTDDGSHCSGIKIKNNAGGHFEEKSGDRGNMSGVRTENGKQCLLGIGRWCPGERNVLLPR